MDFAPRERYFDNASTTPIDPRVKEAMLRWLDEGFGNAHSIHDWGRAAAAAVDSARAKVARLVGAEDPSQIIFVSGSTEANGWVLWAFPSAAVGPYEHSSLMEPALSRGMEILQNDGLKVLPPKNRVQLISQMVVNNEIGTIWDPLELRSFAQVLHSDLTQAVGKLPTKLADIDLASFSAHKFHGPKGVGALYCANLPPEPLFPGEHERGYRSGTLNVAGIVGMGVAAEIAEQEMASDAAEAAELRQIVLDELKKVPDANVHGGPHVSPYVLSLGFAGVLGESLVVEMDRQGYGISAGAACQARSGEPSRVLTALNTPESVLKGTVRISFSRYNSRVCAQEMTRCLKRSVETLRTML